MTLGILSGTHATSPLGSGLLGSHQKGHLQSCGTPLQDIPFLVTPLRMRPEYHPVLFSLDHTEGKWGGDALGKTPRGIHKDQNKSAERHEKGHMLLFVTLLWVLPA